MCTAATYKTKDFYMGRTLDYEFSYGDEVTVTPRNYPINFRFMGVRNNHFAMIGMAHVADDYPLYYEALNGESNIKNVAVFEFIPWILSQCATVDEARENLQFINLTNTQFNDMFPCANLHWIIADKESCITVESMSDGLHIYDNPVGVLTNNPPFNIQMFNLNNYMGLSAKQPESNFSDRLEFNRYSRGMGALGLPGDLSSLSRFVKVAFTKMNSVSGDDEKSSVSQFFHILGSVDQQRGCCQLDDNKYEITIYTCCCNTTKGIYYYTSYDNHQICAVDMHNENLDGDKLVRYPLITDGEIRAVN